MIRQISRQESQFDVVLDSQVRNLVLILVDLLHFVLLFFLHFIWFVLFVIRFLVIGDRQVPVHASGTAMPATLDSLAAKRYVLALICVNL